MEAKVIRHGTHIPGNDSDGYIYSFNTSEGYSFNSHLHKCYEIIHVISGKLFYTVEGREYFVSDGDIVMTNPSELHSFSFPSACEYQREFIHLYPTFTEIYPDAAKMLASRKNGEYNHLPAEKVKKYGLDKLFENMRAACENVTRETDMTVFANVLLLIASINRMLAEDAPEFSRITAKRSHSIYDYINSHYMEDINLQSAADEMFMSVSGAERLFKRETGMTIKSYLNLRRITAAKNLIMEGQKASGIYLKCGFKDYSTFYRAFIRFAGMTPEQFKKSHAELKAKELEKSSPEKKTEKRAEKEKTAKGKRGRKKKKEKQEKSPEQ